MELLRRLRRARRHQQRSRSDARGKWACPEALRARSRVAISRKLQPRYINNTQIKAFSDKTPRACPAAKLCTQLSYAQAFPAPITRSVSLKPWTVPRAATPRAKCIPAPAHELHRHVPRRETDPSLHLFVTPPFCSQLWRAHPPAGPSCPPAPVQTGHLRVRRCPGAPPVYLCRGWGLEVPGPQMRCAVVFFWRCTTAHGRAGCCYIAGSAHNKAW